MIRLLTPVNGYVSGASDELIFTSPRSNLVGTVNLDYDALSSSYYYDSHLAGAGAYAASDERHVYGFAWIHKNGTNRQVKAVQVDADPTSPNYGDVLQTDFLALGPSTMLGMSATPFRSGTDIDALFAFVGGNKVSVFTIAGSDGTVSSIDDVVDRSASTTDIVDEVYAGVDSGTYLSETRILLGYYDIHFNLLTEKFEYRIRVGFLKLSGGSWTFSPTDALPTNTEGIEETCTELLYNVEVVFDADTGEWTLGWICGDDPVGIGGWVVHLQRLNWDGYSLQEDPFRLFGDPSDNPHSGVLLSYNKETERWLIQSQHNARLAIRSETSFTCVDKWDGDPIDYDDCSDNDVADIVPGHMSVGGSGRTFATQVYYQFPGNESVLEFRFGAACSNATEGCDDTEYGGGVSHYRTNPPSGPLLHEWDYESSNSTIWDPPLDGFTGLTQYVRAPELGETALLHMNFDPDDSTGDFLVTFGNESTDFAFDD